ncbi:MAG: TAT-variant-translocated molybdopterin oxidoreductase [Stellaceae bacterium]
MLEPVRLSLAENKPPPGAGRAFWQSLDELAQSPDFLRRLEQQSPDEYARLAELAGSLDRRRFLQLTAATLALSGLAACGPAPGEPWRDRRHPASQNSRSL